MFIPGDQLVDAALERRPELIEYAAERNVVIASPSTLIGLLRAVHVGWREKNLSESAAELFELGRELHQRAAIVLEHAAIVGESIERARKSYNDFVGSIHSRLVPTLRRFEERDARSAKEIPPLRPLEGETRRPEPLLPLEGLDTLRPAAPPPRARVREAPARKAAGDEPRLPLA
jgi:DNA recombination protein RmuC